MSCSEPRALHVPNEPPCVLAIGGFDPCAGAGILADVKTIEAHRVRAMAVITANTIQHDAQFFATHWIDQGTIRAQCHALLRRYPIRAIKIGMVPDPHTVRIVRDLAPTIPVVIDPVLRSTASDMPLRDPQRAQSPLEWARAYRGASLLTPNAIELQALFGDEPPQRVATRLQCPILRKGGHDPAETLVTDRLYLPDQPNEPPIRLQAPRANASKHGTGCVLAAAIAARIALGENLTSACLKAQRYVAQFIQSDPGPLGWHQPIS